MEYGNGNGRRTVRRGEPVEVTVPQEPPEGYAGKVYGDVPIPPRKGVRDDGQEVGDGAAADDGLRGR